MSNRLKPVVGQWYSHLDKGDVFQVVAIDEESGWIEIQEFDGGLDEIEFEEWRQMSIEAAVPPEDWTGPVDEIDRDDLGYSDSSYEEGEPGPLEASTTWEDLLEEDEGVEFEEPAVHRPTLRPAHGVRHRHH
jgi:hypothetical protein